MIKVSVTKPIDSYMDGYCLRCNRLRTECELVRRATGKRCIETVHYTYAVSNDCTVQYTVSSQGTVESKPETGEDAHVQA